MPVAGPLQVLVEELGALHTAACCRSKAAVVPVGGGASAEAACVCLLPR